jgi:hypothetical protein
VIRAIGCSEITLDTSSTTLSKSINPGWKCAIRDAVLEHKADVGLLPKV